jgi:NAD(P)-dependent dehydrogenase (short-subunit alcohol dehydrogenase family)
MEPLGVVVISGAGAGIGRALAVGFAAEGWRVAGLGRTDAALRGTQELCPQGQFDWRVVDVAAAGAVDGAMASICETWGPIYGLVCNAAIYPRVYFLDQSAEDWTRTLAVNVGGVANCCRAALPTMLERNAGRIVVIGSLADMKPVSGSSAYSASKAALHAFVRALAIEIDPVRYPNVLVNEYNPSATATSMSEAGVDPAFHYAPVKRLIDLESGGPTGRMFLHNKEFRPNEGLKQRLRRLVPGL